MASAMYTIYYSLPNNYSRQTSRVATKFFSRFTYHYLNLLTNHHSLVFPIQFSPTLYLPYSVYYFYMRCLLTHHKLVLRMREQISDEHLQSVPVLLLRRCYQLVFCVERCERNDVHAYIHTYIHANCGHLLLCDKTTVSCYLSIWLTLFLLVVKILGKC